MRPRGIGLTLRVVTVRELAVLNGVGAFTFQSVSLRRHGHLRGHESHGRYTVSNVEGRENISPKASPATYLEPGTRSRSKLKVGYWTYCGRARNSPAGL